MLTYERSMVTKKNKNKNVTIGFQGCFHPSCLSQFPPAYVASVDVIAE